MQGFAVLCFGQEVDEKKNDGREWRVANRKTKMYRRTLTRNGKNFISRDSCATRQFVTIRNGRNFYDDSRDYSAFDIFETVSLNST